MSAKPASKVVAWAFALAPAVLFLLTMGEKLSPLQQMSQALALPVFAVEVGIVIIAAMQGNHLPRPPAGVAIATVALVAIAWFSAATADDFVESATRTAIWTFHLLFGLAIANLLAADAIERTDFSRATASGFVLFAFLMCANILSVYRPSFDWVGGLPAYGNIRWFGYYAAAVVGVCWVGIASANNGYRIAAVVALGLALWTGSRGTLLSVIGGYGVAASLFPDMRRHWRKFAGTIFCGILISIILTSLVPIGEGYGRLSNMGSSGRIELWRTTFQYIVERPVLGWGEGQLHFLGVENGRSVQPHNIILQILLAWGTLGLIITTSLAAWIGRKAFTFANDATYPFILGALNIAVFSLIDGSLYHVQSVANFALCVALASTRPAAPMPDQTAELNRTGEAERCRSNRAAIVRR